MTFTDGTKEAGLESEGYSMAVAIGDFDNDGFSDFFLLSAVRNHLFQNFKIVALVKSICCHRQ